ncbi:uncharacterized protein LOC144904082 [Branchiostoma floridae x Branchiostoma belcheri]
MDNPEEDTERIVFCFKKNRPCSRPKGHSGKCDSKRKTESPHQFWRKSPRWSTDVGKAAADKTQQQAAEPEIAPPSQHLEELTQESTVSEMSVCCENLAQDTVPIGEYRPCVQEKRQGEVLELYKKKQELESEVCRLQQDAASWRTEAESLKQEAAAWQAAQVDLLRRLKKVSEEEEKLRQEKERLTTWEKELEGWDEKIRKVWTRRVIPRPS